MANTSFGNVFYFDTNGAINNGAPTKILKVAIWGIDSTSALVMSIGTGVPCIKLTFNASGPGLLNQWQECNFGPGWTCESGSIQSITAGSGYVFIA